MGGMTIAPRTDSDRLDELLEAVEKQTAAINRLAMAVQEEGDKNRQKAHVIKNIVWDVRMWLLIFMAIFVLNGCHQTWSIKL